jgi:hypothetical protein
MKIKPAEANCSTALQALAPLITEDDRNAALVELRISFTAYMHCMNGRIYNLAEAVQLLGFLRKRKKAAPPRPSPVGREAETL